MRLSACFSHVEGKAESWLSAGSISIQVTHYWCHPALTAHSLEEPKVRRWVNTACSWLQGKAGLFGGSNGGDTRVNTPHNSTPKYSIFVTLPRMTEEILKWKQECSAGISHSGVMKAPSLHTGKPVLCVFYRKRTGSRVRPWLTPCLDRSAGIPLTSTPEHTETVYFRDKHDTISVNKENLK